MSTTLNLVLWAVMAVLYVVDVALFANAISRLRKAKKNALSLSSGEYTHMKGLGFMNYFRGIGVLATATVILLALLGVVSLSVVWWVGGFVFVGILSSLFVSADELADLL